MAWFVQLGNALGRHWRSALVFAVGLGCSLYAYVDLTRRSEAAQFAALQESAKDYELLLRHQLDQYAGASRALGAFFSASSEIRPEEFDAYIQASRMFQQFQGISSFGYMPKVPAQQVARFEAEAARDFPGFRIRERRPGADAYYPLLYARHGTDPGRADRLRGIDFSAIPDRWAAMQEAAARDEPVATRVHTALHDPQRRQAVLIYSPVRQPRKADRAASGGRGEPDGFIFTALYVERVFMSFDRGRLAQQFDLEVYEDQVAPGNIVFDADRRPHALEARPRHRLAHRAEARFANRKWLVYFFVKEGALAPANADRAALALAIGLLLTVIASYAAAAWPRYMSRRQAMAEFGERFADFFDNHPFAVYALDRQRRFIQVNRQMARELGVIREDLLGTTDERFIAEDRRVAAARHFDEVAAGNAVAYTTEIRAVDGRSADLSLVMIPMGGGDQASHVLVFAENVTERRKAEKALYESRQMLQVILDNIPQSVFWKDVDSRYQGGNRALLEEAGLQSVDQLIGKTDAELRWKDLAEHFRKVDLEVMRSGVPRLRMQGRDVRRDGSECWVETSKMPLRDATGKVVGVLAVAEDITARKYMEEELFRRANFDSLTGLPNRGYFQSQLDEAIKRAHRREGLALMYFDIDRFKQINDSYGHDTGDQVIRMFAHRVRAVVRECDVVARLGGDEFVLLAEGLGGAEDAALIAQKLVDAMGPPFDIGGASLEVSTSIGVVIYRPDMSAHALLTAADQAMYEAKRAGRNCFRQAREGGTELSAEAGNRP